MVRGVFVQPLGRLFVHDRLVVLDELLRLVGHVAEREEVDERRDERHHGEHGGGEMVDAVAEFELHAGAFVVVGADAGRRRESRPGDAARPGV